MVDNLLQHTAQVSHICQTLLHQCGAITDNLCDVIKKIDANANRFSGIVSEMRSVLEGGDASIRTLSFELRTPLAAITGFSELILQGSFGSLSALQTEQATAIHQHGEDLRTILETLMNNAKSSE